MNIYEKELFFASKNNNYTSFKIANGMYGMTFNDIISGNFLKNYSTEKVKRYCAASYVYNYSNLYSFTDSTNIEHSDALQSAAIKKLAVLKNQQINLGGFTGVGDLICAISANNAYYDANPTYPIQTANITVPSGTTLNDIDCNSQYSYIVGSNGFIAYSTDGMNYNNINVADGIDLTGLDFNCISACEAAPWTSQNITALACTNYQGLLLIAYISGNTVIGMDMPQDTAGLVDIANINRLFVGISTSNGTNYSTFIFNGNFQNISNIPTIPGVYVKGIKAIGDTFYMLRGQNLVLKSRDGQTWSTVDIGVSDTTVVQSVTNLDNNICFLATDGTISQKGL